MNKHVLDYKLKQIEVANTGHRLLVLLIREKLEQREYQHTESAEAKKRAMNKNVLDYKPKQIEIANTSTFHILFLYYYLSLLLDLLSKALSNSFLSKILPSPNGVFSISSVLLLSF